MAKMLKSYPDFRGGWNADAAPDLMADNELTLADNIDLSERGGFSKRKGTVALNDVPYNSDVNQIIEWPRDDGSIQLLAVIGTDLCAIDDDGKATVIDNLNSTQIGYVVWKDKLFYVDGKRFVYYNGSTVQQVAQTSAPSTTPSIQKGGELKTFSSGKYKFAVSFVNEVMGESPLSDDVEVTVDEEDEVTHFEWSDIPTGPSGTTARRLYRTRADGEVFYLVGVLEDNTETVFKDTTPDEDLRAPFNASVDLAPIRRCRFLVRHPHSGRFFAAGDSEHPDRVYYSEPNEIANWKQTNVLTSTGGDGPVHALRVFGDALLAFHKYRPWVYRGLDPEIDATWEPMPTGQGTISNQAIADTENSLTFLGIGGLYAIPPFMLSYNMQVTPSEEMILNLAKGKVTSVIRGIIKPEKAAMVYDPVNERLMLAYCDDPAAQRNNRVLVYDWELGAFTRYTGLFINCWCRRLNGDILAGTAGYILKMNTGTDDYTGAAPQMNVLTKSYNLDLPYHKKKLFHLFIGFRQPEEGTSEITLRIKVDDVTAYEVIEKSVYDTFIWGDMWGEIWGWRSVVTTRSRIGGSGHRVQLQIANNQPGIPTTVYGLALTFRPIRAKGERL